MANGDFKDIRGVMVHHTGSDNASAASIANGRPDLAGPLSQLHIARNGTVTVVAVGVAWHAGVGMYPWLPTNMGNWHMIGIECANSGTSPTAPHRTNWPDAQYSALVRCCAAINRRLSQNSGRTIGHKEYAGRAQGKWDPGAIDMNILRADIQARIGDVLSPAPTPRPPVPVGEYADVLLYRGTEGPQVAQLQRQLGVTVDGDFGPQTEAAVSGVPAPHPWAEGGRHRRAGDRGCIASESVVAQPITPRRGQLRDVTTARPAGAHR